MRATEAVLDQLAAMRQYDAHEIPSRAVLNQVTDHLIKALFPQRLGTAGPDVNGYVRRRLESALGNLVGEVATELQFQRAQGNETARSADEIVDQFAHPVL